MNRDANKQPQMLRLNRALRSSAPDDNKTVFGQHPMAAGTSVFIGRVTILLLLVLSCLTGLPAQNPQPWVIGPFTRPASGNPVVAPNPASRFDDPILKKPVQWEALHTFNPGAIVREGKVYVLYRAEDNSGTMQIGMHTSRLGLAESDDGIHFAARGAGILPGARRSEGARVAGRGGG